MIHLEVSRLIIFNRTYFIYGIEGVKERKVSTAAEIRIAPIARLHNVCWKLILLPVFIRELSCKSKLRFTCAVLIIGERPEIFAGATIEISVKKGDPHNFHHGPRFSTQNSLWARIFSLWSCAGDKGICDTGWASSYLITPNCQTKALVPDGYNADYCLKAKCSNRLLMLRS